MFDRQPTLVGSFKTFERVVFIIGPENRRSRRAVEKIGPVYIGVRPVPKGRERVVYELTRGAFVKGSLEVPL